MTDPSKIPARDEQTSSHSGASVRDEGMDGIDALSEMGLHVLAYNLRRAINVLGAKTVMAAI